MGVRRVLLYQATPEAETSPLQPLRALCRYLLDLRIECEVFEASGAGSDVAGSFEDRLDRARPDVLLAFGAQGATAVDLGLARRRGIPTALVLRDSTLRRASELIGFDAVIVHSQFLADYYANSQGIRCAVLPEPIEPGDPLQAKGVQAPYITFIDPTPDNGVFALVRIADELGRRRPDIPFLVVEGRGTEADLVACGVDLKAHSNVHLMIRPAEQAAIWSVTRIALVPASTWDSPGTVAAAAKAFGIPVVASERGALEEVVGDAGLVLPLPRWLTSATRILPTAEDVVPWVEALIGLWDDAEQHSHYRAVARASVPSRVGERYARFLGGLRSGTGVPRAEVSRRCRWAVLVPYLHAIEYDCEVGLRKLEERGVHVVRCRGSSAIDMARNTLLSEALHRGCEAMLFVDADIGFDPEDALHLLARPEPAVAGVYPKKGLRELASTFATGIEEVTFGSDAPGLYPLEYAAAGFLRVRAESLRSMIDRLELPLCNRRSRGGFWPFFLPMIVPDADGMRYLGEDWAFSHRLRTIGITPMADTSLRLFHIGPHGYSWEAAGTPPVLYRSYTFRLALPVPEPDR